MRRVFHRISVLSFLVSFLYPVVCLAWIPSSLQVYYVWNEFDATVNAFKTLGLIMSDPSYQGLFFGIVVVGIVIGGGSAFLAAYTGHNPLGSFIRWFGVVMIGIAVYVTFIKPTTSITIWDQATNQQTTMGGIPEGIVFLAGITNTLETGFVDMISQANSDPAMAYQNNAGGLSFTIFDDLFNGGINFSGDTTNTELNIYNSLKNYFSVCVYTEMSLPNARISPNDFENTSNFMSVLARANSPAIYVVYYNSASPGGDTLTCQQAWTNLSNDLNNMTDASLPVTLFWSKGCSAAGLSGTSGGQNEQNICYNKAQASENSIFGMSYSASQIFRQYFIAHMMWDVITSNSPSVAMQSMSNRASGSAMIGMGIMANQWIPIMRGVMFSIFIGLLPFLCLLIPTPMFSKSLSYICGIFVFFLCWSICDALVNNFAAARAMDIFSAIQSGQLGYQSMLLFSTAAEKSLAMYGAVRWTGILLAGTMTTLITKFGGMGLTHFAMGLAQNRQYAASAAQTMSDPSDWANKIKGTQEVFPSMAYANAPYNEMAGTAGFDAVAKLRSTGDLAEHIGGGNYSAAAGLLGHAAATQTEGSVADMNAINAYAKEHNISPMAVQQAIHNFGVDSGAGSGMALKNLANNLGTTESGAMDFMKQVGLDQSYGRSKGFHDAWQNAVNRNGFTGNMTDYATFTSLIENEKVFGDSVATQHVADEYFGGNVTAMSKEMAEFSAGQVSSKLNTLKQQGASPEKIADLLGASDAAQAIGISQVLKTSGVSDVAAGAAGQGYATVAGALTKNAMNEILTTGSMSEATQKGFLRMERTPMGAAQLKTAEASYTASVTPENAQNLAGYINSHGGQITAGDLAGKSVTMSFADRNGKLVPTFTVSQSGQKVSQFDSHFTDTSTQSVTGEKVDSYGGKPGNYGGTNLIALGQIQYVGSPGNQIATVEGIDYKGNKHDMTLAVTGNNPGEWLIQHDHVTSSGKTYTGNLINTALNMREDNEVFQDRSAGVVFTNELASQMSKIISKTAEDSDAHQIVNGWSANIGARFSSAGLAVAKGISQATGLSVDGGLNVNHQALYTKQNSITSNRDAIAAAYRTIALSDLPDQEKREMIQDLTRYLMGDKERDMPQLSPNRPGAEIANEGGSDGKTWRASPDYKPSIIPPSPSDDPNISLEKYDYDHDPNQKIWDKIEVTKPNNP